MEMNTKLKNIKSSFFLRSIFFLSSGQLLGQIITILTIPIVSRVYPQSAFGSFAVITATATLISSFLSFGLGSAIMSASDDTISQKVLVVSFYTQLILSTLIIGICLFISSIFQLYSVEMNYLLALIFTLLMLNSSVLANLLSVYINRKQKNKVLFINPLIGSLATIFITIPLGIVGVKQYGLFIANLIAQFLMIIQMIRAENPFKCKINFIDFPVVFKTYKKLVTFQYPANLLLSFANQMPSIFFSRFWGNSNLGDYSISQRVTGLPISLISTPITTVYFRTVSQKIKEGEDVADFTYKIIKLTLLLAIFPTIIAILFSESIFPIVLGEQWVVAGKITAIMIIPMVFLFADNCIAYCLVAIGKPEANLLASIIHVVLISISLFIGASNGGNFIQAITFYAVAKTIFHIIDISINFYFLKCYVDKFLLLSFGFILICGVFYLM